MKKYLFFAAALVALASCSDDNFVGENSPNLGGENGDGGAINFGLSMQQQTRGDIYGASAATLLGNNFYVIGTKGTEGTKNPSPTLVFDNYLVHFGINTAGTTESNTANWEYVGIIPGTTTGCENYVKLSNLNTQTIKYWDYSTEQYDFHAFSTGSKKAVAKTALTGDGKIADDEVGVTRSLYGAGLDVSSSAPVAYTFYIPTVAALKETYITDITKVAKASYGKEVQLQFKNLGSKVRIALYETVPGYSVEDVKFYASTTTPINHETTGYVAPTATAALISGDTYGFPTKGQIDVSFPHVGTTYKSGGSEPKEDYNKAVATVTPTTASSARTQEYGELTANYTGKDQYEADGKYLGRTLTGATFAGEAAAQFYQTVFPVSSSAPITLRVDYTLVSTDGSGEKIKVYGANAVVPSNYTKWLPNYAYTYIFKISDNTNGWTDEAGTKSGLFPITFDAVVAEATDANAEQATITTVATPSITTYQQGHDHANKDEYSKTTPTDKDIYAQVMDNELSSPVLVGESGSSKPKLNATSPYTASLLYAVTSGRTYSTQPAGWPKGYYTDAVCNTEASGTFSTSVTYYKRCTEADVMDALENQTSVDGSGNITGRNGVVLTKNTNIDATVTSIVNGVDDNPITVTAGQAAKIDISALAVGTYAYVYDYSSSKSLTTIYQPITVTGTLASGTKFVTTTTLNAINTETTGNVTTEGEAVSSSFLYFSKTKNGSGVTTYSFVSVDGKTTLPAGLVKCPVTSLSTSDGTTDASAAAFVFTTYTRNDGKYAVKVIKIVA